MIIFLALSGTLLLVALILILLPLLRSVSTRGPSGREVNLQLARHRLIELESDVASGRLDAADYPSARSELERSLLSDIGDDVVHGPPSRSALPTAVLIGLIFPFAAGGLYLMFGTPEALISDHTQAASLKTISEKKLPPVAILIEQLEKKVTQNPDDLRGLLLLTNAYMSLRRYADAVPLFERWQALDENNADLLARYADALAMANKGDLTGKPTALLERALQINPNQIQALWLAAMAADEQHDLSTALVYLTHLQGLVVDNQEAHKEVTAMIASAQSRAATPGVTPSSTSSTDSAPPARLSILVELDPAVAQGVSTTDTVFVYARPIGGSKMPIAITRRRAVEFPLRVILDDSLAVMPSQKLSDVEQVEIVARISRTGNAMPTPGDIIGVTRSVTVNTVDTVTVTLSDVIP
ncbi:MAG: c-type cytochrome biogenesis protein CcmI [Arenicellales bacterium]|jgi:cytochrome c-type biogenesis protein CcmH|nr:c-type cytochrome biogenesis protein CcmI [Arenicellales bacterium]